MSLSKIEIIVKNLLKIGKNIDEPCAIISQGTTKDQKVKNRNFTKYSIFIKKYENTCSYSCR